MNESIFKFRSYKTYLESLIRAQPKRGRGFKTTLAQAAGCQVAYISQVLGGERHFNFEQAEGINALLGHDENESRFFLLLISLERAGTPALRSRYEKEVRREAERHLVLKERFKVQDVLSPEVQATYYSSWFYSAVHIALTLEGLRTKEALGAALGLNSATLSQVLEFLCGTGLAEQRGTRYFPGKAHIYLGQDSPLIGLHHTNWRMRAIASLDPTQQQDLHYSAVVSIPRAAFDQIKELLTTALEQARPHWKDAQTEDDLCALSLDWYRLALR